MQLTVITPETLDAFRPLLRPSSRDRLAAGQPLAAVGLLDDGVPCGALCGRLLKSGFSLDSLFVTPSRRERGGGAQLLDALLDLLQNEISSAPPPVFAEYALLTEDDWRLELFLQAAGFSQEPAAAPLYALTLREAASVPFLRDASEGLPSAVSPLCELPDYLLKNTARELFGSAACASRWDKEVSVGVCSGERLSSFLFFEPEQSGVLSFAYAYTAGAPAALFSALLRTAARLILAKYPPETIFSAEVVSPLSDAIARRILPAGALRNRARRAVLRPE